MAEYVVGVDIGGTKIAAAVVDRAGHLLSCRVSRGHAGRPPEEVIEATAAAAGDQAARDIPATGGRFFGLGLSTIVQVINPDRIVIGGGLARIGPLLLDPCIAALNANIHPVLVGSAEIVYSELGNDAGLVGAADLAWARSAEWARK